MCRSDAARSAARAPGGLLGAVAAAACLAVAASPASASAAVRTADAPTQSPAQMRPAQSRVQQLISQMTLDEKLSFVSPAADPQAAGQAGYIPGVARLGVPPLRLTDGPAGVRLMNKPGSSTALPAPVELASSFDDRLASRYGKALGLDTRALGQDVVLAPMTNIIRVPFGGRNFETFSEDPLLSAHMAASEVQGIQSQGAIATVKHYAENNQEDNRMGVDVNVDEQTMREIELPPFQAAVDAGTGAVMCSYNSVNGQHACSNDQLLNGILKGEWGFKGWVMSDWGATHASTDILAGLDQDMFQFGAQSDVYFASALKAAIQGGTIPEPALDAAVARILGQMQRFGLLDGAATQRPQRDPAGEAQVAQSVTEQGAVLVKNSGGALPLDTKDRSIALIGPTAKTPKIGGGGSSHVVPASAASPLDTITQRAGAGTSVAFAPGIDTTGAAIPASALSPAPPLDATGSATVSATAPLSYTATLTVPTDGDYGFALTPPTYAVLSIDGRPVTTSIFDTSSATVHLTAGPHTLSLFAVALGAPGQVKLTWITPDAAAQAKASAVALAKRVQTPIVFAYDDGTEGVDRSTLSLPSQQDALISAVADANPNTIVVLNTGSSITMPWLGKVKAVLDTYYPGQNGAEATTRLLYGDVNPSGKLTQTFPATDNQTSFAGDPRAYPGVDNEESYSEGIYVGYRWYDKNGVTPLFAFGHGLSYTSFAYRNLKATPHHGRLKVTFTLTNTGRRAGAEVAQAYVGPSPDTALPQAARALAGYDKVSLRPGESRRVTIEIPAGQLQSWNPGTHRWELGTGTRALWVGSSSATLPLHTTVRIHGH